MKRIVTGLTSDGESRVAIQGPPASVISVPGPSGATVTELWGSNETPPTIDGPDPTVDDESVAMDLRPGTFRVRLVDLPPHAAPFPHRTPTVDVVLVMSGRVTLILDDGSETPLEPGDWVVQRATSHAWRTEGDEPCRLVSFVIGV